MKCPNCKAEGFHMPLCGVGVRPVTGPGDVLQYDPRKKDPTGKSALHLVPGAAILAVGDVIEWSRTKYPPGSWRDVEDGAAEFAGAALRHTFKHLRAAVEGRPPVDDESGLPHLAHAATSALYALEHLLNGGSRS